MNRIQFIIYMNNALSESKSNRYFQNSFYFERKGDTDHRNFIPTEVFLDFLFGFSEPALARVLNGQWGRTRKTGPPFFLLDCSKRKERVHDLIWIVNNNKIVLWSSHIFRTYHRFYYFLLFEYFRNLLSAMLYWPVSYHGSRVDNRRGTPFWNRKKL